jgi:hypothetical protein
MWRMSFDLWARPLPKHRPEPEAFYSLKHAIAQRFLNHDGSLRTEPFVVTKAEIGPWLEGVRDAGTNEAREAATRLLELLEENPQGVELWIGDHDDA